MLFVDFLLEKARQMEKLAEQKRERNELIEFDSKIKEEEDDLLIDALKARITALDDIV